MQTQVTMLRENIPRLAASIQALYTSERGHVEDVLDLSLYNIIKSSQPILALETTIGMASKMTTGKYFALVRPPGHHAGPVETTDGLRSTPVVRDVPSISKLNNFKGGLTEELIRVATALELVPHDHTGDETMSWSKEISYPLTLGTLVKTNRNKYDVDSHVYGYVENDWYPGTIVQLTDYTAQIRFFDDEIHDLSQSKIKPRLQHENQHVWAWSNNSNPPAWYAAKVTTVKNTSSCRITYNVRFYDNTRETVKDLIQPIDVDDEAHVKIDGSVDLVKSVVLAVNTDT